MLDWFLDKLYDFAPGVGYGKISCAYDEKDSIGKRYRRNDALGTPFCITVDYESLEDNSVTVRERDSMNQERIKISELSNFIDSKVNMKLLF